MVLQATDDLDLIAIERERRRRRGMNSPQDAVKAVYEDKPKYEPDKNFYGDLQEGQPKSFLENTKTNIDSFASGLAESASLGLTGTSSPTSRFGRAEREAPISNVAGQFTGAALPFGGVEAAVAKTIPRIAGETLLPRVVRGAIAGTAVQAAQEGIQGDLTPESLGIGAGIGAVADAALPPAFKLLGKGARRIAGMFKGAKSNALKRSVVNNFVKAAEADGVTISKEEAEQILSTKADEIASPQAEQAGATGSVEKSMSSETPSTSPVDDLKSQIDAVVPKDAENKLASERQLKIKKVPKALEGLAAEARKSKDFDEFEHNYLGEIKHGTYWHWTDDPNFTIDPNKGPRDMSSMGSGSADVGKLMVTSDIDAWSLYGPKGKGRRYAALIDLSDVDPSHYKQVRRGFGNEFFVSDPSKAKVIKVYDRERAFRVDRERAKLIPQSSKALREFYDSVVNSESKSSLPPKSETPAGESGKLPESQTPTTPLGEIAKLTKERDFTSPEGVNGSTYSVNGSMKNGNVIVEKSKNGFVMRNILLDESLRGKGIGKSIYEQLNQESIAKTGKPLRSIVPTRTLANGSVLNELSGDAINVWESFVKNGKAQKRSDGGYEFLKTPTQPADAGGTSRLDKSASAVESAPVSAGEGGVKQSWNLTRELHPDNNGVSREMVTVTVEPHPDASLDELIPLAKKHGLNSSESDAFYSLVTKGELYRPANQISKSGKPHAIDIDKIKAAYESEYPASANNPPEKLPAAEKTTAPEPEAIGLNKAQIETIRKTTGLDELPQADRDRHIEVLNRAKTNGTDKRALDIANDIKKSPRPLTNEEHAGMVLKTEELYKDWRDATQAVSDIIERGGNADDALARVKSLENDLDLLTEASDRGGREAARSLSIRRMLKSLETDDIIHVRRQATATKGAKLTAEEDARLAAVVAEKDAALKRLDEESNKWKAEYEKSQAQLADELVRRESNKAKITQRSQTKREKIVAERIDILKKLKERGHEVTLNAGVNPEDAYLIGKLALNYVKEGVTNLDEVVRLVMNDIPNLTKRDVWQSINSKNPDVQAKAKSAAMLKVNKIKRQAELLVKIEDAENGIFDVKRRTFNTPNEIKALQARLRELKLQAFETVRNADRLERTQKAIDDIQTQLRNQYRNIKAKKTPDSAELATLKEKLKELRRTMKIDDELAILEDQIRTGDFEVPAEVTKRSVSPALERAEIDLSRARRKIKDEIEKIRPKSIKEKAIAVGENIRAIKATADLSATLRQGAISVVSHPIKAAKNFVPSLKAAFSQFKAEQIDNAIKSGDMSYLHHKAKLELADLDGLPTKREEYFAGSLIEKFPGLGQIVKASNRHMVTFLNLMRSSMFDDFVRKVPNATTEELQMYAKWINVTTGRGDLGKFAQAGRTLGTVFFAPRFAVSRIQTPFVFYKAMKSSPRVRAQVAKEAVAVASTATAVLALGKLSGAEVGDNPRESDYGKIKIGNERIDIFAGYQQPYRLIARAATWATDKTGATGQWLTDDESDWNPLDDMIRFAQFKLAPQVTLPVELITGKTPVGQGTTATETLMRSVQPMIFEALHDAWKEEGAGTAIRSGALNLLGVSSNVYPDSKSRLQRDIKRADYLGDNEEKRRKQEQLKITIKKTQDTKKAAGR